MSEVSQSTAQSPLYNELALRALGVAPAPDFNADPSDHVVIGFVDYGFDLLHPSLLDASGTKSRFKCLWDQNRTPHLVRQAHFPLSAAYDYSADAINKLIAATQNQDRSAIDAIYDPHQNYYGRVGVTNGAHGTQMASIAAGTAFGGFRSPAPFADLIGVQLAVADTDWREETASGEPTWRERPLVNGAANWDGWRTYDACPQIAHAIHYIYDRACRLGAELVIINLSIGTWAGAHDGCSLVEQAIAKVVNLGRRPGSTACQVVVGAGNAGADQGHFTATIEPGAAATFRWVMNRADRSQNKLEIWYDGSPLQIELTGPSGNCCPVMLRPELTHAITLDGVQVGLADHVIGARGSLSRARILLHPPLMASGQTDTQVGNLEQSPEHLSWTLTIRNAEALTGNAEPSTLHAWVERDDGVIERSWLVPHHVDSTLCCLATAPGAIVVAGGHHHAADGALRVLPFSGRGPSPWRARNRVGSSLKEPDKVPEALPVMAPAYNIWGARSKSTEFVETSGTSAAAALMSGVLAARHHDAKQPDRVRSRSTGALALSDN
jgi:hypothetical protein